MSEKIKELKVSAIENGTVIDHIPSTAVFQVIRILKLDSFDNMVLFATNLESKKYGTKGLIKVSNKFFKPEELNKIALVAPHASIIEIRDFQVSSKKVVEIPEQVTGIVKCFNPNCVTNHEQINTRFSVIEKEDLRLKCHFCEKITRRSNIEFK
ncbi:MAG: aspartate carbamoyltransferase regulatory subunit [Bacteroidales bacterium]|jgi:aspartate carbamoyltransferase regulatory subunit|nr:aspartate carbamoyltransferase regulatory subunit [Bacteroidales bacterium]NLM92377.1 aspartate carbamoyltransferase regulatory subunit [Bacteroidales bacterium]